MAGAISRRKLADYVAERIVAGDGKRALDELAAYLVATGRVREQQLLVRDIEAALADRGVVVADVTSAGALSADVKSAVTQMIGADKVYTREIIDQSVLGGVRVDLPGQSFDGTVQRKLTALRGLKTN